MAHGFRSLPSRFARRVLGLKCWPGVAEFRLALGRFVRQPTGLSTHFFGQSSALIRFAAHCLFDESLRVMVTDLAWPAYVRELRQVAAEHEFYKSPDFSGERSVTRIHVRSHDAPSSSYRVYPMSVLPRAANPESDPC